MSFNPALTTTCTPKQRERRLAWAKALRKGGYKQTRSVLCRSRGNQDAFCCLGVAIWEFAIGSEWRPHRTGEKYEWSVTVADQGSSRTTPPIPWFRRTFGYNLTDMNTFTRWNDSQRRNFAFIAQKIEESCQ